MPSKKDNEKQTTAFQKLMFAALAKRGLGSALTKGRAEAKQQKAEAAIIRIPRDKQTGLGAHRSRDWLIGGMRPPGKTGISALQWYRRVVEPVKCPERGPRGGACRNAPTAGRLTCSSHGSRGRNRGTLVELRPEEVPVLLCDR